jgi:cytochrome P450
LYLLATHPETLEKLKTTTANLALKETVTDPQLTAVINESMRLYPPAWISDRVPVRDDAFNGFSFPKDTIIVLFYYGLHRDGKYWDEPNSFIPDRFKKSGNEKEKTKAFYPFGAGPRLCIGNNFAMAEMTIFLQAFIQLFAIRPTAIKPKLKPLVTLRPDRVMLEVRKRES